MSLELQIQSMNHEDISNLMVEKEKEMLLVNDWIGMAEQDSYTLKRAMIELQMKKEDSTIWLKKKKLEYAKLKTEISILSREFWRKKEGRA